MIHPNDYAALCRRDPDDLRNADMVPVQRDRLERFLRADHTTDTARVAGAAFLAAEVRENEHG